MTQLISPSCPVASSLSDGALEGALRGNQETCSLVALSWCETWDKALNLPGQLFFVFAFLIFLNKTVYRRLMSRCFIFPNNSNIL